MNKRKIILITEKQAKMLINQLILESKKYKGNGQLFNLCQHIHSK